MTDSKDEKSNTKKPLTLSSKKTLELKKTVGAGQVRQSFSHGRSKTVTVEVKKKRVLKTDKTADNQDSVQGKDKDWERRVEAAQKALEAKKEVEQKAQERAEQRAQEAAERLADEKNRTQQKEEERKKKVEKKKKEEAEAAAAPSPSSSEPGKHGADKHKKKTSEDDEKKEEKAAPKRKSLSLKYREPKAVTGKITLEQALDENEREERSRSLASMKRAREKEKKQLQQEAEQKQYVREVILPETITVQELANRMATRSTDVIKALMNLGVMATINQVIEADTAELIANEFGHKVKRVSDADVEEGIEGEEDIESALESRAPVVTIMGHVDHGKTSLLDALRESQITESEAGGITQHIGAYQTQTKSGQKITFIDTPGHAAFTQMRARGANVTDLVILVVAADDGIMEQTKEAINHAKAAGVPIIVAINKMDKPDANPDRVRQELLNYEIVVEEYSGDVLSVEVSALKKQNLDKLLDAILLQSEMLELKANPNRSAVGAVIESKMELGKGAVATVLVQKGTLNVGDTFVAGTAWGRVKALIDDHGKTKHSAGPSVPVEVVGLNATPEAGEKFVVVESDSKAREISEYRVRQQKNAKSAISAPATLENLFHSISEGKTKELPVLIKADVQGSVEAIVGSLEKIATDEVKVKVVHTGVGGINESDVTLAKASKAVIIGFNVRANLHARNLAGEEGVELKYYSIIYNLIDELKGILGGLLAPTIKENFTGRVEVREVFNISKIGTVAGCYVTEGVVKRGSKVRLLRDDVVVHEGSLKALKRFKDEVKEVKENFECGITLENYNDIKQGDVFECFEIVEEARTL